MRSKVQLRLRLDVAHAMTGTPTLRLYGRRKGKRLRRSQEDLLREVLPRIRIAAPEPGTALDPKALFEGPVEEVWLEIGFGGGEHLAALAREHPAVGFVGCEPFINGVVKLLAVIDQAGLENVRIYPDDGRAILEALRSGSVGRIFALFPDPWPKLRHHKRRLVQASSLDLMARALVDGGELRLASDDGGLVDWMIGAVAACGAFAGPAGGPRGHLTRPSDWPPTRYELKALEKGARPAYLSYRRGARL